MKKSLLIFFILISVSARAQTVLKQIYDADSALIFERIKSPTSDTVIEYSYGEGGQVQASKTTFDGVPNGVSKIFYDNGKVARVEYYNNGKLNGLTTLYYYTGQIQLLSPFENGFHSDTSVFLDTNGIITKKVSYNNPCTRISSICDKTVTIYKNGDKAYSYLVVDGYDTDDITVYNEHLYRQIVSEKASVTQFEMGELLFRQNCAACHRLDKKIIGPPLNCISDSFTKLQFESKLKEKLNHNSTRLTSAQADALLNYINASCVK